MYKVYDDYYMIYGQKQQKIIKYILDNNIIVFEKPFNYLLQCR